MTYHDHNFQSPYGDIGRSCWDGSRDYESNVVSKKHKKKKGAPMTEALWTYKREPAGMGEWCYRVYRNGVYWFYLEDSNQAMIVVNALNRDAAKSDAVLDDVFDNLEFLPASVDKTNIVWITMRDVQELITNKKVELRQQQKER